MRAIILPKKWDKWFTDSLVKVHSLSLAMDQEPTTAMHKFYCLSDMQIYYQRQARWSYHSTNQPVHESPSAS